MARTGEFELLVSLVSGLIPAVRARRVDSAGALRSAG